MKTVLLERDFQDYKLRIDIKDASLTSETVNSILKEGLSAIGKGLSTGKYTNYLTELSVINGRRAEGGQCKFSFSVGENNTVPFNIGAKIKVYHIYGSGGTFCIFSGIIFEISRSRDGIINCIAYDYIRYLNNKCFYSIEIGKPVNAKTILEKAFHSVNLEDEMPVDIDPIFATYNYNLNGAMTWIFNNRKIIDVINEVFRRVVVQNISSDKPVEEVLLVYHDYEEDRIKIGLAKSEILDAKSIVKKNELTYPIVSLGDKSFVYDYSVTTSISNTYNHINVLLEDPTVNDITNYKLVEPYHNPVTRKWWGVLATEIDLGYEAQYSMTKANVDRKMMIDKMLKYYNRPTYTLTLSSIGIPQATAGKMILINLPHVSMRQKGYEEADKGLAELTQQEGLAIVDKSTHTYNSLGYTMNLTLSVNIKEQYLEMAYNTPAQEG